MCLYVNHFTKYKQAKKNLTVYKALYPLNLRRTRGESPYKGQLYEKYNIYTAMPDLPKKLSAGENQLVSYPDEVLKVSKGLHCCLTRKKALEHSNHVVKMVIPEGAWYIIGDFGEVVTDTLIW